MDTFGLKIISSDRVFYEGRCRKMIVPVPTAVEWKFFRTMKIW